jgi:L-lactate permease
MKYSQQIGIVAALALIGICFLPWIYVESLHLTLNGINGKINEHLTFGRQIIPHTIFCSILIIFFLIPTVWAKRTNLFIGFLNLSWAIKNYIIFTMCRPECPQIKPTLYALVLLAITIQLCTFLPKMKIK